jgi:hypothetical protein
MPKELTTDQLLDQEAMKRFGKPYKQLPSRDWQLECAVAVKEILVSRHADLEAKLIKVLIG